MCETWRECRLMSNSHSHPFSAPSYTRHSCIYRAGILTHWINLLGYSIRNTHRDATHGKNELCWKLYITVIYTYVVSTYIYVAQCPIFRPPHRERLFNQPYAASIPLLLPRFMYKYIYTCCMFPTFSTYIINVYTYRKYGVLTCWIGLTKKSGAHIINAILTKLTRTTTYI